MDEDSNDAFEEDERDFPTLVDFPSFFSTEMPQAF